MTKKFFFSSTIQTILSVLEFHQINHFHGSRTLTAGKELHLAPKNLLIYLRSKSSTAFSGWQVIFFTKKKVPAIDTLVNAICFGKGIETNEQKSGT